MSFLADEAKFPCCEHCVHEDSIHGHSYECSDGCNVDFRRDLNARIDADNARIRTELHHRLNQLDDTQLDALAHELADTAPDAVNDALNEIGAP